MLEKQWNWVCSVNVDKEMNCKWEEGLSLLFGIVFMGSYGKEVN